jgi:phosphoribosylglycinamide formyltransferase 2
VIDETRPLSVMILGAGELSRELVTAFQRLGLVVIAVDRYADAPAHGVADGSVVIKMTDPDELTALIEREQPDYVVTEAIDPGGAPVIDNDALVAVGERGITDVVPTARSTRLSLDREGLRRLAADELGLPTAPFWFAGSADELAGIAEHAGFPLVVRPVTGAPGEGESVLLRAEDVEPAWDRAVAAGGRVANTRVMAETMVEIDHEVTLLTVRSAGRGGPRVQFCEPIGHRQVDGELLESWQPQEMTAAAKDAAKSIAARIVEALGGRGVHAVELLVKGNEVYFVDVGPRPYDSGLVTLRSQRLSEFELHARAILGLPVDTIMITPGAAEVVYAHSQSADLGDDEVRTERATQALSDALAVPESDVRIFGHPKSYPRRRLGVALATAADVKTARDRVHQVATALRKFW